jgi:hypothetical protein
VLFIFNGWRDLIHEQVKDPVTAEIVRLVGDGLFLSALSGVPLPDREIVERMLRRLSREAAESLSRNLSGLVWPSCMSTEFSTAKSSTAAGATT